MFLYIGSGENKIGAFQVDEETGNLIRTVEIVDPVIDRSLLPPPAEGMFSKWKSDKVQHPATEWIMRHPTMDYMYAFTSFGSQQVAVVTTYHMDSATGRLTKLGVCSTGGLQAAYATFSPDLSLLVVVHHNDGRIAFFDCNANGGVLEAPVRVVETPEVNAGTRSTATPTCLPSLYHCLYSADGKYLLAVDASKQSRIWTYPVDAHGMVLSNKPKYNAKILPIRPPPGAVASLITSSVFQSHGRLRRVAIHPNGRYLYVLFETHSVIQVYEITNQGKILLDCLQEIPAIDPSYFDRSAAPWNQKIAGAAFNMAAELLATPAGLWVSNRGVQFLGNADNSMQCYEYQDNGARLVLSSRLEPQGPVRHFAYCEEGGKTKIVAGMNKADPGLVETFIKTEAGKFEKVGQAATGLDVLCLVVVPEVGEHV